MATYGYDLQINPIFEKEQSVSLPTPLGMELSTQLSESMKKAPFWSFLRSSELAGAAGHLDYAFLGEAPMLPPELMEKMVTDVEETRATRKTLNQQEWENSEFNIKDSQGNSLLRFEDMASHKGTPESYSIEVNEDVAKIMAARKQAEMKSKEILSRSPGGVGRGILGLGASFVGQALDPLNIAASFIPVVGPGFLAGRLGIWGSRMARGAIEGAVGNALVEPLVWAAATQEQAEYGAKDFLTNIAFGAGIGVGGHVIFGKLGDVLKIRSQADHIERIKAVIKAVDEAEPVNLDPLLRASDIEAKVNIGRVELKDYLTKNELRMTPEEIKARQEFDATTKKYNLYDEEGNVILDPEMRQNLIIAREIASGASTVAQRADLEKSIPLEPVYNRQVDNFGIVKDAEGREIFDPLARKEWIDKNILPETHARETNEWTANQTREGKEDLVRQAEQELVDLRNKTLEDARQAEESKFAEAFSTVDRLTFTEDVRSNLEILNAERAKLWDAIKEDLTPVGKQLRRDFEDMEKGIKQLQTETKYKVDTLVDCLIGEM